jgi:capsular polysaccharide biosynthesis protein
MSVRSEPDSFEFADYFGVLRHRWWLIVILACVGVVAAGAYLAVAAKAYKATVTVSVTPTGTSPGQTGAVTGGRTSGTVNLDTEAQIVQSSTVAAIAAHALGSSLTPRALLAQVSVAVPANSSILQISCIARTAHQAAACANAFGSAYLKNRSTSAASLANTQLTTVRGELTTLEQQTALLTTQISTLPTNSAQRASAQAQLVTASSQLKSLADQAATLTGEAASSSGGSVLSQATPPPAPSSPKKSLVLASGLLAGLVIGLLAAFGLDRRDLRITDARGLARFGLPALLSVPATDFDGDSVVAARSLAGLEFTELARATAAALGPDSQLLLIAGTSPGSSTSVIAANLAVTLARARPGVILACFGHLGAPDLLGLDGPKELDAAAAGGLASGATSLDEVSVRPAGAAGLRVLSLSPDLGDLQHEEAQDLVSQLIAAARYVVIEAPAPGSGTDSFVLAQFCDAALLAVEIAKTKRPELEDSIRRLDRLGIRILGTATVPALRTRVSVPRAAAEPEWAPAGSGWRRHLPGGPANGSDAANGNGGGRGKGGALGSGRPWARPAPDPDGGARPAAPASAQADAADRLSGD